MELPEENESPDLGTPELGGEPEYLDQPGTSLDAKSNQDTGYGQLLAMVAKMGFGFVATRRGEHWALTGDEATELAAATEAVMAKYWPEANAGPELALIGISAAIVAPRLLVDMQEQAKAESSKEKPEENEETVSYEPENTVHPAYAPTH